MSLKSKEIIKSFEEYKKILEHSLIPNKYNKIN